MQQHDNATLVSMGIAELWHAIKRAHADGRVTDQEHAELERRYVDLQRQAHEHALTLQMAVRLARRGHLDRNFDTSVRDYLTAYDIEVSEKEALTVGAVGAGGRDIAA